MSASAPSDRLGSDASGHSSQPSTHPPISVVPAGNLTTLLRRLEAATSRLEDIASSASTFDSASPNAVPTGSTATKASASAPELPIVTPSISQQTVKPDAPPLPISIQDMDTLIDTDVKAFIDSSKGLDPLVEEQAAAVAKGFADQRRFLLVTTKAKRPDQSSQTFMDLLKDLQQDLGTAGDIKDSNRGAPVKEHLAMVAEGISTLQWLVLEGKPADTVGEMIGGAQMYGNRVLKNYKEGDQAHVKFVRSYYALLNALKDYIKKHYPMGVTWNASGVDAAQAMREIDSGPTTNGTSAAAGGPPPPPPPPPLPNFDNMPAPPPPPPGAAPKAAAGGDMGAVFDQLNRGESVTKGLKKVDPSQMTHKNPELRAASVVPGEDISRSRSPGPQIKPKPQSMRQNSTNLTPTPPKKEPKKELDGNKWLIENFDSPSQPITIDVSLSQSILITACKNTTIILKGKANAISIDNSPRLQILVETLVSSVDVIKSPNFAIQITGAVPTILLDQVDGASLYLSKESLACEVFTSKCSSVNLVLPPESEDADDSKECPLPEQIRTYIKGGKLVSEIVEHAG